MELIVESRHQQDPSGARWEDSNFLFWTGQAPADEPSSATIHNSIATAKQNTQLLSVAKRGEMSNAQIFYKM